LGSSKKKNRIFVSTGLLILFALLAVWILMTSNPEGKSETVQELMRDAVLHSAHQISLFGILNVNPAVLSGFIVTIGLLTFALVVRIFVIPKFTMIPGRFQSFLEWSVETFDGLAKSNSPHRNRFIGAYIFSAGVYIFIGTLFELTGLQWVATDGISLTLPAPLADINSAIAMGGLSYFVILMGGFTVNGFRGLKAALKEFSLPLSMSFRLYGALLSGLLVTELVYYTIYISFVVPAIVGVLFTLLHALIQTYVLTMLTSVYFGEVTEPYEPKPKNGKNAGILRKLFIHRKIGMRRNS